jgi:anti-anti-sigma factor
MRLESQGTKLRVSEIPELGAANANRFRDQVRAALTPEQNDIEVDLGDTGFIDSCGLGALIALQKTARSRNGSVRLLRPQPPVQQMLKLTRMNKIFEIVS